MRGNQAESLLVSVVSSWCLALDTTRRTKCIRLTHCSSGIIRAASFLVDLRHSLISDNHRGIHGNGLLHHIKGLTITFGLTQRNGQIIVIISIQRIALDSILVILDSL